MCSGFAALLVRAEVLPVELTGFLAMASLDLLPACPASVPRRFFRAVH